MLSCTEIVCCGNHWAHDAQRGGFEKHWPDGIGEGDVGDVALKSREEHKKHILFSLIVYQPFDCTKRISL